MQLFRPAWQRFPFTSVKCSIQHFGRAQSYRHPPVSCAHGASHIVYSDHSRPRGIETPITSKNICCCQPHIHTGGGDGYGMPALPSQLHQQQDACTAAREQQQQIVFPWASCDGMHFGRHRGVSGEEEKHAAEAGEGDGSKGGQGGGGLHSFALQFRSSTDFPHSALVLPLSPCASRTMDLGR